MQRLLIIFIFSFIAPFFLLAQDQTDEKSSEEIVAPYQVTNVSSAIQSTDDQVRTALEIANDTLENREIKEELDAIIGEYKTSEEDSVFIDLDAISLWGLKDVNQLWEGRKEALQSFNDGLSKELSQVSELLVITTTLSKKWNATKLYADTCSN